MKRNIATSINTHRTMRVDALPLCQRLMIPLIHYEPQASRLQHVRLDMCRNRRDTECRHRLNVGRNLCSVVIRRDALASRDIETPPTDTPAADAANEVPSTPTGPMNRKSRRTLSSGWSEDWCL